MSKEDSSTGPFRPISLSPTDKKLLQVITQTILKANFDRYQRFWGADDGKVNPSAWKLVKSKDQTCRAKMIKGEAASPFRPMSLSLADMTELQVLAKTILDANFDQYLRFTDVDPNIWKLVKFKDQGSLTKTIQTKHQADRTMNHFCTGACDAQHADGALFVLLGALFNIPIVRDTHLE
ncbi:hypothetical protein KRP22_004829 [Phytophthora ramorum]|nr:hypothetical protein KRP22_10461 [Phytophthora ramorum]